MSKSQLPTIIEPAKTPTLNDGHDAVVAKELIKRFKDAQNAGRRIMAFGLFAWEIKETKLKHGQWGPWLAANAPDLCRPDSKTGAAKPSASLNTYMQMTRDVLEDMGFTIEKYFKHISNSQQLGICHGGKFLLLPPKKLSESAAKLKDEICNRVDGKTAKQIRLAFGQVEEDDTGAIKPKRGRLKGQGGASKEQRAAAAAAEEKARIEAIELEAEDFCKWIDDHCDEKGLPLINDAAFDKLCERAEFLWNFCRKLRDARKKGGAQ